MNTQADASVDAALDRARRRIDGADARLLLAHALQRDVTWLYAHGQQLAPTDVLRAFDVLVARRAAGEPVAYLVGRRGFWTMDLAVTNETLIPRPETELLVELALQRLPPGDVRRVVDLGTGSGAIALAIACERPDAEVLATDRSVAALAVAHGNAVALGLGNVRFVASDWLQSLAGEARFAMIATNPPYIAEGDVHLREGDLRYEPRAALSSGSDGLAAIRCVVAGALTHLEPGGWLLLEHGWTQGKAVRDLLATAGYVDVTTAQDLESRDRVTMARRAD